MLFNLNHPLETDEIPNYMRIPVSKFVRITGPVLIQTYSLRMSHLQASCGSNQDILEIVRLPPGLHGSYIEESE